MLEGFLDISPPAFRDRHDAGRHLAERLRPLAGEQPIVIGLPRGGVPVAAEVAEALGAPLDVVLVRKVGCPFHEELGVGALGEDGTLVIDDDALAALGLMREDLAPVVKRERDVLADRRVRYRAGREPLDVTGRTVILVDDGIATGGTARVAARVLRGRGARRIVLAVPVGPAAVQQRLGGEVDEIVCLVQPPDYFAVGQAYVEFAPTSDEEVTELLRRGRGEPTAAGTATAAGGPAPDPPRPASAGGADWSLVAHREVVIPADGVALPGDVRVPPRASGLVVFAHGSGSSRLSPRNVRVAAALNAHGLATLLFDLLSAEEGLDRERVFDIPLLVDRLVAATDWAAADGELGRMALGYFGASTGAAAALGAAARRPDRVRAVVSRGGRPDLAAPWLEAVRAPTLLIVGGADVVVLDLNREAAARLTCPHELAVVPGATHLFEEPGALQRVTELTAAWFTARLAGSAQGGDRPAVLR